jgi:hypothetical protein
MVLHQKGSLVTISIHIDIDTTAMATASPNDQLTDAMAALGFVRADSSVAAINAVIGAMRKQQAAPIATAQAPAADAEAPRQTIDPNYDPSNGDPGPEDIVVTATATEPKKRGRKAKAPEAAAEEVPNITASPEDRQDPQNPEPVVDDAATAEQDAEDEAAETAASAPGNLTLDDVRNALSKYVKAYGMEAAQADGPILIAKVLGREHDPEKPCKISDLGDDQALIERAIGGVAEMLEKNPFKRAAVA